MAVNGLGALAVAVAGVECAAGLAMLFAAGRRMRASESPTIAPAADSGTGNGPDDPVRPLLLLLALFLGGLALVSGCLWTLVLQSYVPLWQDVRCVVGVLRVGAGSEGATGWLPFLASSTSVLRIAALFAAGAAACLHLASRDDVERRIRPSHAGAFALVGLLAMASAATQTAYVLIPKSGRFLTTGCCTTVPTAGTDAGFAFPHASAATFAVAALCVGAAFLLPTFLGRRPGTATRLLRFGGAVAAGAIGLGFVNGTLAPAAMGTPLHECAYCLVAWAPETALGLALLATPALAAGWGAFAGALGPSSGPSVARLEAALRNAAVFGCLGAISFFGTQLWVSS